MNSKLSFKAKMLGQKFRSKKGKGILSPYQIKKRMEKNSKFINMLRTPPKKIQKRFEFGVLTEQERIFLNNRILKSFGFDVALLYEEEFFKFIDENDLTDFAREEITIRRSRI